MSLLGESSEADASSQLPNQRAKDRPTARKLSGFIKRIFVELERDRDLYPDGNTAEVQELSRHMLD
jgi:hypothetical protein